MHGNNGKTMEREGLSFETSLPGTQLSFFSKLKIKYHSTELKSKFCTQYTFNFLISFFCRLAIIKFSDHIVSTDRVALGAEFD